MKEIIIAIPTGRMEEKVYNAFASAGLVSEEYEEEFEKIRAGKDSRRYAFEGEGVVYVRAKPADVPFCVDSANADMTICGNDCKLRYELSNATMTGSLAGAAYTSAAMDSRYDFPKTRFCVIGEKDSQPIYAEMLQDDKAIIVATEYPEIAMNYLCKRYPQAYFDFRKFNGKTENAVKFWGADVVFDIVETGRTLKENGLEIFEEAMPNPTKILASNASLRIDDRVQSVFETLSGGQML